MNMAEAKRYFKLGVLKGASVDRFDVSGRPEYTVKFSVEAGGQRSVGELLDSKRSVRVFKSLDGAVAAIEAIGFQVSQLRVA